MRHYLRFGIPSLDSMVGFFPDKGSPTPSTGFQLEPASTGSSLNNPVSVCIIGNDGAGKSVLSLHLAAEYLRTHSCASKSEVRVLYVSMDLTLQRARDIWRHFALGFRDRVTDPFLLRPLKTHEPRLQIELFENVRGTTTAPRVEYLDLRNESHGDDWGFINRLLATIPEPHGQARHLMVIDAVDGLELLVGEHDAYGQRRDRRSRITQLLRAATPKSHLVFIAESKHGARLPEEFVSDMVIRVGAQENQDYSRRTLEVEKVRGQGHVRGMHAIAIRPGWGSTTGTQENADDPVVVHPGCGEDGYPDHQSYFYVFPSVHRMSRALMDERRKSSVELMGSDRHYASFHMCYLDEMLPGIDHNEAERRRRRQAGEPLGMFSAERWERGVPAQEPAALIGEEGTHKGRLSKSFLAGALRNAEGRRAEQPGDAGVAVLITTKQLDQRTLGIRLNEHFTGVREELPQQIQDRVLCRRLEIHHLSPAIFVHIVRQMVARAQRMLLRIEDHQPLPPESVRAKEGYRIRLVIDNWSALRSMYPEIAEDRRILPYLLFYFRREGIPTVLVATEAQGFRHRLDQIRDQELRDLTGLHLYTWRIPFFGESRIALSVNPPTAKDGPSVFTREVRDVGHPPRGVPAHDSQAIRVNPALELYEGILEGRPKYVETAVYLYKSGNRQAAYLREVREMFRRLMGLRLAQDDSSLFREDGKLAAPVVRFQPSGEYEGLREFSELQGTSRFPHTIVLQVDEFWAKSKKHPLSLRPQADYLQRPTLMPAMPKGAAPAPNMVEDPFLLFQPRIADAAKLASRGANSHWSRLDTFQTIGYDLTKHIEHHRETLVKVPYTWDFGFLAVYQSPWKKYLRNSGACEWGDVVSMDKCAEWVEFIALLFDVHANMEKKYRHLGAFTLREKSPDESFSCLALEMWASEMSNDDMLPRFRHEQASVSLLDLARCENGALFRACMMIAALFPERFFDRTTRRMRASILRGDFLASRSWFGSMPLRRCVERSIQRDVLIREEDDKAFESDGHRAHAGQYRPVPLPGRRITRGDWFLAIARGSRSTRIGERALDILCSHRANVRRIQTGVGLPVRGCIADGPSTRIAELWTPIVYRDEAGQFQQLHYNDLRQMGAWDSSDRAGRQGVSWLWRSRIKDYERHARVWRRWLCTVCEELGRFGRSEHRIGRAGVVRGGEGFRRWMEDPGGRARSIFENYRTGFIETLERITPQCEEY